MLGVILVLFGYLLGAVPTGLLVGWAAGVDIRRVGSGNIGTANVLRAVGKWAAGLTMFGDMLKGLVPVLLARLLVDDALTVSLTAFASVAGHCWPVFLRFKGGKGVATGAGTILGLAPLLGLGLFGLWWIVAIASRYTSLAAIITMAAGPLVFLVFGQPVPYVLYTLVGGALIIWLHRENVRALLNGTERKVGQKVDKRG